MKHLLEQTGVTKELVKEAVVGALAGAALKGVGAITGMAARNPMKTLNAGLNAYTVSEGSKTLNEAARQGQRMGIQASM